jgi:concanavalin A-like lectin/glucanase superfamily protein
MASRRLLVVLLLLGGGAWGAWAMTQASLPVAPASVTLADLNLQHPILAPRGLLGWWVVAPPLMGGGVWWNVLQRWPGTLTNMGAGSGWGPTTRPSWYGEMRFDGADDSIVLGTDATFDFVNTTFTVCAHFWSVNSATQGYIIGKRSTASLGGWFVRLDPDVLHARIEAPPADYDRTSVGTYNNGLWHSVVVIFTTDTATAGTNSITIYVDGVLEQGTLTGSGLYGGGCPSCNLMFGAVEAGASLAGALDNVRIYQRALSAAEALAYHRDRPPDFGGVVLPAPLAFGLRTLTRRSTIE